MVENKNKVNLAIWKSRAGVAVNWGLLIATFGYLATDTELLQTLQNLLAGAESAAEPDRGFVGTLQYFWKESIAALILGATGHQTFARRVKTQGRSHEHFTEKDFTDFPQQRPGYSDRAAYTLAELSELAYHKIRPGLLIPDDISEQLKQRFPDNSQVIEEITESLNKGGNQVDNCSRDEFVNTLSIAGFELLHFFDIEAVQGFVCLKTGKHPYIVVSFRGSEARIEDWLTNASAQPMAPTLGDGKVHSGFYNAFMLVKKQVMEAIESGQSSVKSNDPIPVFFTGHSLGGALALVAARTLEYEAKQKGVDENIKTACYTFGAPRIGDYAYFEQMKTPVYRLVNSADIVPRVPPGAVSKLINLLIKGLSQVTTWQPTVHKVLVYLEDYTSTLHIYRHHGDMRFLPDLVDADDNAQPEILANPNQLDMSLWFWRRIMVSLGSPVKSHSMLIYLKKLKHVAKHRL